MADELNPAQQAALERMRELFQNEDGTGLPMNDVTYLRYLRARNFKVEKSITMLRATIQWRKDFGLANMHEEWKDTIAVENSTGKTYVRGFDKEGHAVIYLKPVNENTHNHDGNLKHVVYNLERAVAIMDANGRGQQKLSLVIDYNRYSLSDAPPMKTSKETLHILQDHYPERLFRAYCVRPPVVFYTFYQVISPFIDSVTKKKICMVTNSDLKKPTNKMFDDIDRIILETSVSGLDERPFDSAVYLQTPFDVDYLTAINGSS